MVLVHVCCAPDATTAYKRITDLGQQCSFFFYNPNIYPVEEYQKRLNATRKLANLWKVPLLEGDYDASEWTEWVEEFSQEPEGGARCLRCIEFRLRKTALKAKENGFDVFATSLTTSPRKNAQSINTIGEKISSEIGVIYMKSDFKKKDGFLYSVKVSKMLNLYRQNYCGCVYSLKNSPKRGRT